jgi:hypothetical protein
VVNLSGGTIAAGGSCTFSVNVVGTTGGHKVNTTGTVTSSNGGSGNQATATIDVEAPDLTITKTHSGKFTKGLFGATYTVTVSNVGFGPTVGTVTVVDNPPLLMVVTAMSGTGWSCNVPTRTCTRSDALPSGSSYPVITVVTNLGLNIANNFTNKATVSGGGDVNPTNNTASDPISLGPPIVITPHGNVNTASTRAGASAQFSFDVEDDDPTLGMVAFGCSGLPVGTACTFNPPATNQASSQVTLTVSTSSSGSNAVSGQLFGPGSTPPFYALLLPALGLLGFVATGRKKKSRLRLALVFAGIMTLLSFAGCGGVHGITTPAGNYTITVSATTATVQATTQITLTVQ